ncbi:hypothetical protein V6N13_125275 [Hibiscus sabdariffa]|uniref:Uncharacterized protein n=1 Tax=Hibiscus sabdariffa TaxID=183260 RepID=A0ABR2U586_9ROSI
MDLPVEEGRIQTTVAGVKIGGYESSSCDRLVYLTTCHIRHMVEAQFIKLITLDSNANEVKFEKQNDSCS